MVMKGPILSRPYDDFIPAGTLAKVIERRRSPTGMPHKVKEIRRAGKACYDYPWSKMELGDYFTVPLGNRSPNALRVAFAHAAARHDFEISVVRMRAPEGHEVFRVTVVIIGVTAYKTKAEKAGVKGIRYSDGRWRGRKRDWEKQKRTKPKTARSKPAPAPASPFWADDDPELPQPETAMVPEIRLTREEVIKRALAANE